jgi:uncharacterized protein YoxC
MDRQTMMIVGLAISLAVIIYMYRELQSNKRELEELKKPVFEVEKQVSEPITITEAVAAEKVEE